MVRVFRMAAAGLAVAACVSSAMAQWGTTSTNSLIVGDATSDIPIIAQHPSGGVYIAFQGPVGGNQWNTVHLQRLDAAGHEIWPHNGVIAVPGSDSASFVGDFDLATASDGNAIVVNCTEYSDPANPTVRQVSVQKFDAATGAKMWGTGGADVHVTTGSFPARPAHVCATPDGGCIVGYTLTIGNGNGVCRFWRYDASGNAVWTGTPPQVLENAGNDSLGLIQLQPAGADGSFIALFGWKVNTSQVGLQTTKFTGAGVLAAGWGTGTGSPAKTVTVPLTIDAHGMTGFNYYNARFVSDGNGGGVYGWSSSGAATFGAPVEALVQHVLSSGTQKFGNCCDAGGSCFLTTASNCASPNTFTPQPLAMVDPAFVPSNVGRYSASVAYNQTDGTYFLAAGQGRTDSGIVRSAVVQKFDPQGNRLFTPAGFVVMPESSNSQVTVDHVLVSPTNDGGAITVGNVVRGTTTTNRVVFENKTNLDNTGFPNFVWNKLLNSDATTDKGRNAITTSAGTDDPIVAFVWGGQVAAARITSSNGAPGVDVDPPMIVVDVPAQVTANDGDTITLSIQVTGTPTISYRWQRHYAYNVAGNPDAYWNLTDGDSSFNCVIPQDGTTYSGTQTNTLTIHNVHANVPTAACPNSDPNLNLYRCFVFNSGDSTVYSSTAQILVNGGACCAAGGGACTFVGSQAACAATGAGAIFQGLGTSCQPNPCGGACCASDGTCTSVFSSAQCTGSYQGDGTTCTPNPCPGTCCALDGSCTFGPSFNCSATGSRFTVGGACQPNPCAQPGACCSNTTGACTSVPVTSCGSSGQTFQGVGMACDPSPCAPTGACCSDISGACSTLTQAGCPSGGLGGSRNYLGDGTSCSPNVCPAPGACCNSSTGNCTAIAQHGCSSTTSTFQAGGVCQPNPCTPPAACCDGTTGACSLVASPSACSGYLASGSTTCSPSPCPSPVACCQPSGCYISLAPLCSSPTQATTCSPDPCAASASVCCRGSTCSTSFASASACTSSIASGLFAGATFTSGACNAAGNNRTPCCYADFNKINSVTVQDIFDFLHDWFAGSPYANVGHDGAGGTLAVQNIFDFLNAWFAGGC